MYITRIDHMDLDQIANSGQCFRWKKLNNNTYGIPAFNRYLEISQDGDMFTLSCDENEWNNTWKNYFDIDTNYNEAERIVMEFDDEFLKAAYQFGSGIRILRQDLWEVIVSFIISQNNNIPRIKKSIEKLCNADENNGMFPNFVEVGLMDLSGIGLGYRDEYLKDAAFWWADRAGCIERELRTSENPRKILKEVKGVGNKVADCICLFGLHCLDAFPIDTHIKNIIDREYNGEMPEWINSEYAGLFQQYIFYYELNHRPVLQTATEFVGYADQSGLMPATS